MADDAQSGSNDFTIRGRLVSEFALPNVGHVMTCFVPEEGIQIEIVNFDGDKVMHAVFGKDNMISNDINPALCLEYQTKSSRYGFDHEYTLTSDAFICVGGSYEDDITHSSLDIYPHGLDGNQSFRHFVESDGRFFQSFVLDGGCVVTDDNVDFKYYNAQGQVISVEDWIPEIHINFTDITDAPEAEPGPGPLKLLPDIKPV
ncbi:MAG TPA: hypothetical protein VGF14_06950 [Alphaproteobacteria bacterium]